LFHSVARCSSNHIHMASEAFKRPNIQISIPCCILVYIYIYAWGWDWLA
jgi:hypothetical protein